MFANYPGGAPELSSSELRGEAPAYVITPTFNLVRVQGTGDFPVAVWKARYPDGSRWWIVSLITMREDKISKFASYFAEEFAPPEWRSAWAERGERISNQGG